MRSRKSIAVLLLLILPLGFSAVWRLQHQIDRQLDRAEEENDDVLLRSGKLVRVLSLEYGTFLADVYWTRAVQYFGLKRFRQAMSMDMLWPLLDLSTTLDPHLLVAYRFGCFFLAEPPPQGAGQPNLAVMFVQRGIAANPEYWRLYQDLGFLYYWELRDYHKASEAFLDGSRHPDALDWMKVMAAKIAGEGRSRETSMFLWRQIYESTKDDTIRKNAFNHVQLIKAESDMEQLDEILFEFEQEHTRLPDGFGELIRLGLLPGRPLDPAGYPYALSTIGKVEFDPKSPLAITQRSDELGRRRQSITHAPGG